MSDIGELTERLRAATEQDRAAFNAYCEASCAWWEAVAEAQLMPGDFLSLYKAAHDTDPVLGTCRTAGLCFESVARINAPHATPCMARPPEPCDCGLRGCPMDKEPEPDSTTVESGDILDGEGWTAVRATDGRWNIAWDHLREVATVTTERHESGAWWAQWREEGIAYLGSPEAVAVKAIATHVMELKPKAKPRAWVWLPCSHQWEACPTMYAARCMDCGEEKALLDFDQDERDAVMRRLFPALDRYCQTLQERVDRDDAYRPAVMPEKPRGLSSPAAIEMQRNGQLKGEHNQGLCECVNWARHEPVDLTVNAMLGHHSKCAKHPANRERTAMHYDVTEHFDVSCDGEVITMTTIKGDPYPPGAGED